jgi:uncharacterized protein (DUF1697 family)
VRRQFAFLRAINTGRRRVTMARLREILEEAGLANVETLLASGNVVFDARRGDPARLERRIEKALAAALGFEVETFLRSEDELRAIAAWRPFGADVEAFQVGFLREAPSDDVACALLGLASETDALDLEGRELSWKPAGRLTDSPLGGGLLERTAGMPLTVRNVNTVHRLLERFASR